MNYVFERRTLRDESIKVNKAVWPIYHWFGLKSSYFLNWWSSLITLSCKIITIVIYTTCNNIAAIANEQTFLFNNSFFCYLTSSELYSQKPTINAPLLLCCLQLTDFPLSQCAIQARGLMGNKMWKRVIDKRITPLSAKCIIVRAFTHKMLKRACTGLIH